MTREWIEVTGEVTGRARPAVPEELEEGERADEWLLEIDGELSLVSYEELKERVEIDANLVEKEIVIPVKDIVESNFQSKMWQGPNQITATAAFDPSRHVVHSIDFENGITFELLEQMGIE